MAIKLLKKSKQRKLLEEVKRTAQGIGQDNSWKEDWKAKSRGLRPSIVSTLEIGDEEDFKALRSKKVSEGEVLAPCTRRQ